MTDRVRVVEQSMGQETKAHKANGVPRVAHTVGMNLRKILTYLYER